MSGFSYACTFSESIWKEADDAGLITLVGYSSHEHGDTVLYRRTAECAATWPACECASCQRLKAWRAEIGKSEVTP